MGKIRSILYKIAKYMGDYKAVEKSIKTKSADPIIKRIARRIYGKISSRGFRLFK